MNVRMTRREFAILAAGAAALAPLAFAQHPAQTAFHARDPK